jgi:hypothetical protein
MNWFEKIAKSIRSAPDEDAAAKLVKDYLEDDNSSNNHSTRDEVHVHLHQGKNGPGEEDDDDKDIEKDPSESNGGGEMNINELAQRVEALEQQVQALMNMEQEEVELEEPETQDRRRYVMRKGKGIRAKDEDLPVPERKPEIIGETDLPGIEDLNARNGSTTDSTAQESLWQDTMAAAEIIVPGIRMPTFDASHKATLTAKRLCAFRRQTMDAALKNPETKEVVSEITGLTDSKQVKSLNCDTVKMAFQATANAIRNQNNMNVVSRASVSDARNRDNQPKKITISDLQKANNEFWSKRMNGGALR